MPKRTNVCRECRQLACCCDQPMISPEPIECGEDLVCRRCGHKEVFTLQKGPHLGAYCCQCRAWIKWLRQYKPEIIVIQDTREQKPLDLERYGLTVVREKLDYGDYSIKQPDLVDKVCIERKSIDDLAMCCVGENRERFERELTVLRNFDLGMVMVEASIKDIYGAKYRSKIKPTSILASMARWMQWGIHFVAAETHDGASYLAAKLLMFYAEEYSKSGQIFSEIVQPELATAK